MCSQSFQRSLELSKISPAQPSSHCQQMILSLILEEKINQQITSNSFYFTCKDEPSCLSFPSSSIKQEVSFSPSKENPHMFGIIFPHSSLEARFCQVSSHSLSRILIFSFLLFISYEHWISYLQYETLKFLK